MSFSHLGRDELLRLLDELMAYQERIQSKHAEALEDRSSLVRELELNQIELEVQNRNLREMQVTLEESRDRYADLYDFAPIGYFTLDTSLTLREINLTGAALLGKPRDELLGRDFVEVAHVREPQLLREHLSRSAAAHGPSSTEMWMGRDGRLAVQLVSWAVMSPSGRPTGYRCAMHDISRRKEADEQRRRALEAEQRLRQRFEALDRASQAAAAALAADAPGGLEAMLETMASESLRVARARYAAIELNDAAFCAATRVVARTGQPEPTHLVCTTLPIQSAAGRHGLLTIGLPAGAPELAEDDRKSLEMLLERVASAVEIARLRQREVREHMRLSLLEMVTRELATASDVAGVCKAITSAVRALSPEVADFGMVYFTRTGPVPYAGQSDSDRERALSDYFDTVLGDAEGMGGELSAGTAELEAAELMAKSAVDEEISGSHLHSIPLRHGDHVFGLLCIGFYDGRGLPPALRLSLAAEVASRCAQALERAVLVENLQRAIQARDGVLAIVSHDLRSPLNAISLSVRELIPGDACGDRRKTRRQVDLIRRCAERMDQLIEDLLTANSLELGQLAVAPRAEPLHAVVAEACQYFEPIAAAKSVTLRSEVAGELQVRGDRKRLLQVFSNLIGNAIKFTPKGGQVTVSCEHSNGEVKLSVCDTGPGIPAAQHRQVFERYWTSDPNHGGLGLGLYIAKRVVEAHGGSMWVESAPAGGAVFSFTLPTAT